MNWNLRLIQADTDTHQQMLALRNQILRIPFGIELDANELVKDRNHILLGAFDDQNVLRGCCLLEEKIAGEKLQLRQMAVDTSCQRKGMGESLLRFAETTALGRGYKLICLHARKTALSFYQKNAYLVHGEEFEEVGMPHVEMYKVLKN